MEDDGCLGVLSGCLGVALAIGGWLASAAVTVALGLLVLRMIGCVG